MFANNSNYNVRPILYYDDINPHSRAVLMILNMLDVDIELRAVEMIKGEHLKPAYAKINPAHTVPTMVHKDLVITGNAIFSYVCENNDNEKANQLIALKCYKRHCCVLSRLFFESQVLHRIHGHLMTDLVHKTIFQTDLDYHQRKVEHAYDVMEAYLSEGQFMAGTVLTAADISFVACLGALDMMFPIDGDRKRWEKLNDWYRRMRSLSIQKINEFGIEKQRQIVEYFAKFQFKSDIKRFTTGLRESQIPSFPSRPDRCSVSIQTVNGPVLTATGNEPTVDILSTQHNIGKITYLQEQTALPASGERNTPAAPNTLKDGVAPKIGDEINKIAKTKISRILNAELEKELALFTEPEFPPAPIIEASNPLERAVPILSDAEKSVSFSKTPEDDQTILTDRSLGGAHKEKPPVPPKRKRNAPPQEEQLNELNNTATNVQKPGETEATVEPTKLVENSVLCTAPEKQECVSVPNKYVAPSQPHQLSRLNGGVESTILIEMETNQIQIQPPAAFPLALSKLMIDPNSTKSNSGNLSAASLISASNSKDVHKLSQKPAKTRIGLNSTKTNSQAKHNISAEMTATETLIPEGLPINVQQVALSYTRGAAAPNLLLAAPPPSPENHSQDEEFPPPPSELLIPKPTPRAKTTPNKRLPNVKATFEPNERFGKKKFSCGKPKAELAVECTAKLVHKRSCELKSLTGRKYPAQETKVCKLAKKLNNGGLFASGTRSLCSNPSQSSIPRERYKRVTNPLNIVKPIPKFVAEKKVSQPVTRLDKKTQKVENDSAGTSVESFDSSPNCMQKLLGHTSNCSEAKQLKNQSAQDQQRVEGGGQWTPPATADDKQKALSSLLQSKTLLKMEDESKNEERWQHNNSSKSTKPRPKTPPNPITKDMKTANQNFLTKNKQKAYPTQTRFQAKNFKTSTNTQPPKFFDTSPYRPAQSFNKQQSKVVAEKRSTTKNKKKKTTKAHNNDNLSNKTQAPLNDALPTPTPVVGQNATQQFTPAQIAPPTTAVGTVSSTLKTLTETIHISPNVTTSPTSNSDDTIVADVPVKVGLVAKALQTLNVASSNFRPATYNISKELTPARPLLPPPLPPNHRSLARAPPPPPPLPVKDILPQAGTVAKALQSLSAVTSDANPLCGSVKPFRKADLKMKFMDSARSSVVTEKGLKRTVPFNGYEKTDAKPLAEILTATVKQMNQENFDEPKSTALSEGIKEMLLKMKTLPDKDMMPTVLINSMTESTKPFQSSLITPSTSVITGIKNSIDKITVESKSNKPLLPAQQLYNVEDFSKALVPPIICEPVQVLVPQKKVSVSESHDVIKSYPSWAACTDTTILSASEVKSNKEEKNKLEASKSKRYAIDRNMINDGIIDMEPTPLPGQPNIIITGYTRAEPKSHNPVFIGTGRPLGNAIPATLRRPTNGLCTHGPSANVVISTFGYTPMPDLDTIPENLMHLLNKPMFNEQQTAPPPPPSVLSTATAAQQVTAVSEERVLAARRPYPTAHRSGSQRRANQQINFRGHGM